MFWFIYLVCIFGLYGCGGCVKGLTRCGGGGVQVCSGEVGSEGGWVDAQRCAESFDVMGKPKRTVCQALKPGPGQSGSEPVHACVSKAGGE
jgi:hypothetical protein